MKWDDITGIDGGGPNADTSEALWKVPASKIKQDPGARSGLQPISESAIGYLCNREGYKGRHVPHGWRSSFSTIMNKGAEWELGADIRLLGPTG